MKMVRRCVAASLVIVVLTGCSAYELKRKVETAELSGDWDQAVVYYLQLVQEDPTFRVHF